MILKGFNRIVLYSMACNRVEHPGDIWVLAVDSSPFQSGGQGRVVDLDNLSPFYLPELGGSVNGDETGLTAGCIVPRISTSSVYGAGVYRRHQTRHSRLCCAFFASCSGHTPVDIRHEGCQQGVRWKHDDQVAASCKTCLQSVHRSCTTHGRQGRTASCTTCLWAVHRSGAIHCRQGDDASREPCLRAAYQSCVTQDRLRSGSFSQVVLAGDVLARCYTMPTGRCRFSQDMPAGGILIICYTLAFVLCFLHRGMVAQCTGMGLA